MAHLEVFLAQLQALFKPQALQQGPGAMLEGLSVGRFGCGVIDLGRAFKITALTEEFLTQSIQDIFEIVSHGVQTVPASPVETTSTEAHGRLPTVHGKTMVSINPGVHLFFMISPDCGGN